VADSRCIIAFVPLIAELHRYRQTVRPRGEKVLLPPVPRMKSVKGAAVVKLTGADGFHDPAITIIP
jgi:hypothetical protein